MEGWKAEDEEEEAEKEEEEKEQEGRRKKPSVTPTSSKYQKTEGIGKAWLLTTAGILLVKVVSTTIGRHQDSVITWTHTAVVPGTTANPDSDMYPHCCSPRQWLYVPTYYLLPRIFVSLRVPLLSRCSCLRLIYYSVSRVDLCQTFYLSFHYEFWWIILSHLQVSMPQPKVGTRKVFGK